jgi:diaminopimelate epimerase
MGNPHAICFVPESGADLESLARSLGPLLETHSDFPQRCNAEFTHVHSPTRLELVVWERGVGITQACGTGACATAVAACKAGYCLVGTAIDVELPGGTLVITVAEDYSHVLMRGPAEHVFDGHLDRS